MMVVMKEHDPNDDPFAGLYQEEPTLVSPMEFGSGVIIHKPTRKPLFNAILT
jgi:hypothetical protein